jgi:AcrR family transcriptional regulator
MVQTKPDTLTPNSGRPRLPETDKAIMDATLRLLATKGYARMSIDNVAAEAKVGKPTIYLRYKDKADLATAAIAQIHFEGALTDTGDTRADLLAQLRTLQETVESTIGMQLIGTFLAEEQHTPELIALFRERIVLPRRQIVRQVLERGKAQGQIRPEVDSAIAIEMMIGSYYARYLAGENLDKNWPEQVVNFIWPMISSTGLSGNLFAG